MYDAPRKHSLLSGRSVLIAGSQKTACDGARSIFYEKRAVVMETQTMMQHDTHTIYARKETVPSHLNQQMV